MFVSLVFPAVWARASVVYQLVNVPVKTTTRAMSSAGKVDPGRMADAMHFIQAFPEAQAFNVVLTTEEKRGIISVSRCSRQELNRRLPVRMAMESVHFFIRPLLRGLVMLDLDKYKGHLDIVLRLRPRALLCTSPGNYQAWFMVNDNSTQTPPYVLHQLTIALDADTSSAKPTQQGRLPGSTNVKPGKCNIVQLMHSCVQNLDEEYFLTITKGQSLRLRGSKVEVVHQPAKHPGSGRDHSRDDWKMCCEHFENNPDQSVDEAMRHLKGTFFAKRPNQAYYESLTARKRELRVTVSNDFLC